MSVASAQRPAKIQREMMGMTLFGGSNSASYKMQSFTIQLDHTSTADDAAD